MKKSFFKSLSIYATMGIASVGFLAVDVHGQQLQPLPPVISASESKPAAEAGALPEIVPAGTQSTPAATPLPKIVSASSMNAPVALPPVVSGTQQALSQPSIPVISPRAMGPIAPAAPKLGGLAATPSIETPESLRGKRFPEDAQQRIAAYMQRAQENQPQPIGSMASEVQQMNYPLPQNAPLAVNQNASWQQDGDAPFESPVFTPEIMDDPVAQPSLPIFHDSDLPMANQPMSSAPMYEAPLDGGMLSGPMPSNGSPYTSQDGYFESTHIHDSAGQYGGTDYSPANVDYGDCSEIFGCCGFVCDSTRYFVADALYWQRGDGDFRASNIIPLDDYDWSPGGRITLGRKRDCTRGWEASYMQFDPWIAVSRQASPAGQLIGAVFTTPNGLPVGSLSAFQNATWMEQYHKTDLLGAELNRTWWGSDVAKLFIGGRAIYFDDQFRLSSSNLFGQQGVHTIDAQNMMLGLHIGGEALYDIGYRLSFSVAGKLGGYANFYEVNKQIFNNGTFPLLVGREDTDLSYSGELGVFARFKLTRHTRLRAGYEAMALLNVYDAESNYQTAVLPPSQQSFHDGSAFFHGASFGFEVYR